MVSITLDADDPFGKPEILPRIGEEYQAELPPLIDKSEDDHMPQPRQDFFIGLSIPVTWISGRKTESPQKGSKNILEASTYSKGYVLVPGLLDECWSEAEEASIVLGLYIFLKNFDEVRRFIETKEMGTILSFYYGRFYGSEKHSRWLECRKTMSKKRACGKRIFSGLRHRELLSRLLLRVSDECRSALLEVSKKFGDEKMSLVDYVSFLKSIVGMNILVEAVGIGTGKRDLTRTASEPSRPNQIGKTWSSLTTSEIIKFLGGDTRLSKSTSHDLFWEAVWPRLLARGWHSEQPNKHSFVFLIPGVGRFSRRKLVKGDQYFDSVADVLSKVARDPSLIELDNNEEEEKVDGCNKNKEQDKDESDILNRNIDAAVKFTVVDKSLPDGKVRELRTLPRETSSIPLERRNGDSNQNVLEENHDDDNIISKTSVTGLNDSKKLHGQKQKQGNSSIDYNISKCCRRTTATSHQGTRDEEAGPTSENGVSRLNENLSNTVATEHSLENHQTRVLIDLNSPPASSSQIFEDSVLDTDLTRKDEGNDEDIVKSSDIANNPRRHSRRNRLLTNRAVEAIAGGYLNVNVNRRTQKR